MVEGRGYKTLKVDYKLVHHENKDVDIDSCEEMQAVLKAHVGKILGLPDDPFTPIFECGELNERSYPIDARYAFQIGEECHRFQCPIEKPLVEGSSKIKVDSSTESRIHRAVEGVVKTMLNKGADYNYVVAALNILMSRPLARSQMRHCDLEPRYDEELAKKPGISIVIPIDDTGVIEVWEGSHKYVQAAKKVEMQGTAPHLMWSEFRKLVGEVRSIAKTTEYFGEDEMFMILDNTIHAGAKNNQLHATFRLHIYIVIEGTAPNTMDTNLPCEIVWDLTREGATSLDFFSSKTKVLDTDTYVSNKQQAKKSDKKSNKRKKSAQSSASAATEPASSQSRPSPMSARRASTGSARSATEEPAQQQKKRRGRPRKS